MVSLALCTAEEASEDLTGGRGGSHTLTGTCVDADSNGYSIYSRGASCFVGFLSPEV